MNWLDGTSAVSEPVIKLWACGWREAIAWVFVNRLSHAHLGLCGRGLFLGNAERSGDASDVMVVRNLALGCFFAFLKIQ